MIRVGILGFGFMGHMHFNNYKKIEGVEIAAICDVQKDKLTSTGSMAGNIGGTDAPLNLEGIELYTDAAKMFAEAKLDILSITLPTYLHKDYTIKALNARINVLCEKPMALNSAECKEMITAAQNSGKSLQVGHCIRFWPEYAAAKKIVDSGKYGNVKAAMFRRLSPTPTWSWDSWILDVKRSGGAMLDLHIHDADYIQYLFGMPCSVFSRAAKGPSSGYDHTVTQYIYDDDKVITAEGGWMMADCFNFEMSFEIVLDKAVICFDCTKQQPFMVYPDKGNEYTPQLPAGDGYLHELQHFINTVKGKNEQQIITPQQSMLSVSLIETELRSVQQNQLVTVQ